MKNRTVFSVNQMNWLAPVAGAFLLFMTTGVSAEPVGKPCAADAERLCKGVQPGEGRVARCMKEHEKELSPGCKENIVKLKEKIRDVAEACKDDAARLCKDTKPGQGRVLRCLKQQEDKLSPACKEQLTPQRARR